MIFPEWEYTRHTGEGIYDSNFLQLVLVALSYQLLPYQGPARQTYHAPIMIRDADKALHFVFPGTLTDLKIAKQRLTYS